MNRKTISKALSIGKRLVAKPDELVSASFSSKSLLTKEKDLRVFCTTVIRGSVEEELTGYLFEVDWLNQKVVKQIPIPIDTVHPFWNSRGGNRGGRGVFVFRDMLHVATAMSILKYDNDLNFIGEITHPYMAGLHEIFVVESGIWVTSTVHDLILKIDFEGNSLYEWWGSESGLMQDYFDFKGRELNLSLDFDDGEFSQKYDQYCKEEVFHFNTVWVQNDEVYAFSSFKNALVRILPKPEQVIFSDVALRRPHNGILMPDGNIIVNDTKNQALRIYSRTGELIKILSTPVYPTNLIGSSQFARPGWQRGLTHVAGSVFLVGTSPATIFEVDVAKNVVGKVCKLDDDVHHCVHGVTNSYLF